MPSSAIKSYNLPNYINRLRIKMQLNIIAFVLPFLSLAAARRHHENPAPNPQGNWVRIA
jgi:hypothetical protein